MALIPDQGAVEKLAAASADPAFGYRVHPGRPHVTEHGADPGTGEDRVERSRVVRAAVADHLTRCACSPRSMIRLRACWAVHSPVGCRVTPRMRMRLVACSMTARTWAWVPSSRSAVKKSHARIASAWDRRNCDQVGADRRDAGSIPAFLRISHTVEAATFTPRP